jgi:hypothetical protein
MYTVPASSSLSLISDRHHQPAPVLPLGKCHLSCPAPMRTCSVATARTRTRSRRRIPTIPTCTSMEPNQGGPSLISKATIATSRDRSDPAPAPHPSKPRRIDVTVFSPFSVLRSRLHPPLVGYSFRTHFSNFPLLTSYKNLTFIVQSPLE